MRGDGGISSLGPCSCCRASYNRVCRAVTLTRCLSPCIAACPMLRCRVLCVSGFEQYRDSDRCLTRFLYPCIAACPVLKCQVLCVPGFEQYRNSDGCLTCYCAPTCEVSDITRIICDAQNVERADPVIMSVHALLAKQQTSSASDILYVSAFVRCVSKGNRAEKVFANHYIAAETHTMHAICVKQRSKCRENTALIVFLAII